LYKMTCVYTYVWDDSQISLYLKGKNNKEKKSNDAAHDVQY